MMLPTRNFLARVKTFALIVSLLAGCQSGTPRTEIHMPSRNYNYIEVPFDSLEMIQKVYVPVYSDIYHGSGLKRFLLTATLSVRNTSMDDSLYVREVDYFDSEGKLNRTYLKQDILITPLGSVEFVVEDSEMHGGAGANFIVEWGTANPGLSPVIQAVMIGTADQQGISFLTEGVVVETRSRMED